MKKNKGFLLSVLILLMTVAVACSGQNTGGSPAEGEANPQPPNNESASNEKMTLKYISWEGDKLVDNAYAVQAIEEMFGVDVVMEGRQQDTYKEQLLLDIASGNIPDHMVDQQFPDYDKFVQQGVVAEIPEDFIAKHAPNYMNWLKKNLGDDPFMYYRRDGKNYSLPIIWTLGTNGHVVGIREDWLKNVGIAKTPETLEELEEAMVKFRNDDPDKNGQKDTYGLVAKAETLRDMFTSVFGAFDVFPGAFVEKDGKAVRGEIEPGAKEALTVLNRWYKMELIDPEFIVNKGSNVDDKVISGKAGVVQNSWWSFTPKSAFFSGKYFDNIPGVQWALIAGPKGPNGHQGLTQQNPVASSGFQFGKHMEEQPDKMAKYLEVMDAYSFNTEAREKVVYGEEGKTFRINEAGDYEYISPYDQESERIKFGIGTPYSFPGNFNDYEFQTPFMTLAAFRDVRKEVENIGKGKYDILQPINRPVYNEYFDRLEQFAIKNLVMFITGDRPLDEFGLYVEEWLAMGGDKVMEEAQQKYDEFFK